MPRKTEHPAFAAMLAESARTGMPQAFKRDLTFHDSRWLAARAPALPFLWSLRTDGTHVLGLEAAQKGPPAAWSGPEMVASVAHGWPESQFYLWDGVALQPIGQGEAARAAVLAFLERERERADENAARYCQGNPSTPHEWRKGRCCFCDFLQPQES